MYIANLATLNEAEVTHGGTIKLGWNSLPSDLQEKIKDKLKSRGKSEDEIKTIIANYKSLAMDNQYKESEISMDGIDIIDGVIHHQIEVYDKARDMAILQANDIVKAYKEAANLQYEKASKYLTENAAKINQFTKAGADVISKFFHQNEFDTLSRLLISSQDSIFELQERYDLSDEEIKRVIVENTFKNTDDPNEIKDLIQARITYSNLITQMFKTMLQQNYKILGITDQQAKMFIQKIDSGDDTESNEAIANIKDIIDSKAEQFHKRDMYDLRPIGGGCIFYTKDDLGAIKSDTIFKRMIQLAMTHDAVVVAHGLNRTKAGIVEQLYRTQLTAVNERKNIQLAKISAAEMFKIQFGKSDAQKYAEYVQASKKAGYSMEKIAELQKKVKDAQQSIKAAIDAGDDELIKQLIAANKGFNDQLQNLIKVSDKNVAEYKKMEDKIKSGEEDGVKLYKEVFAEINKLDSKIDDVLSNYSKALEKYRDSTYWGCQPVRTLKAGPFTNMNKLISQLIKEGFKNIYIMSCNPGSHELDPKILKTPGIKIHHATHSLLSENYEEDDSIFDSSIETLDETTAELEAYNTIYENVSTELNSEILTEAHNLKDVWNKVKQWIQTAIKTVVNFFKKIVNAVKGFIERLKAFFKSRSGKLKDKVKTGVIRGDGSVYEFDFDDYDKLKTETVKACDELSAMIQKYEQESLKGMQEAEKYADQQSKKAVNESVGEFDALVNMLW